MGNKNFSLGKVQYDTLSLATFPLEAQIGVGVGASIVALIVLIIVLIYRSVFVVCHQWDYSNKENNLGKTEFLILKSLRGKASVATWKQEANIWLLICSGFCRRKSKQALRDYKKVQIQLENLETSVRDRCKKEFTGKSQLVWRMKRMRSGKEGLKLSPLHVAT